MCGYYNYTCCEQATPPVLQIPGSVSRNPVDAIPHTSHLACGVRMRMDDISARNAAHDPVCTHSGRANARQPPELHHYLAGRTVHTR